LEKNFYLCDAVPEEAKGESVFQMFLGIGYHPKSSPRHFYDTASMLR